MGRFFYATDDILIMGKHINSATISLRADFSWDRHFSVPASQRLLVRVDPLNSVITQTSSSN